MDQAARAAERVGDTIAGKYRLERLLGAGGMGAVYEAVHEFTQRRVAVKLMHPGIARSAVAAERFLREAQAPSAIGHRGIVEVLDGGRDRDGSLYLVLELLQGRTLAQAFAERALDARQAGAIGLALLSALRAAHEAGFVHRDIKPENVFLAQTREGGEPEVKLLDFGVAGLLSSETKPGLTQAGSVLGTPLYMSPEQALGRRVDARSDLWSVGAVLYQALSGRAPFSGDSFQALLVSISTDEHLPLSVPCPHLPLRLVAVIERALQKDVGQRWQSAAQMAEALGRALEGGQRARPSSERDAAGPGASAPAGSAPPAADAPRRRAVPARLIAVTLVVLGGAGAALALLPRASSRTPIGAVRPPRDTHAESGQAAPARIPVGQLAKAPPATPRANDVPPPARETEQPSPSAQVAYAPATDTVPAAAPAQPSGLSPDTLMSVMRQHDAELQRCYETDVLAALMQPDGAAAREVAPTRLDVQLEVASSGAVTHVSLEGAASAALKECANGAIRAWRFPNSAGPTRARFPLVFQPSIIRP